MNQIESFFILGNSVETELGKIDFLKVKDYPTFFEHLVIVSFNKYRVAYNLAENDKSKDIQSLIESYQDKTLYDLVSEMPELQIAYSQLFLHLFEDEDILSKVNRENFEDIRHLIMRMNYIRENKASSNPELQKWKDRSQRAKQDEDAPNFADVVSSVAAFSSKSFEMINEMTLYQLYYLFHSIGNFKAYDTSTLFATVSSEKIDIQSWCKHIELYEEDDHSISKGQFLGKGNGLFN